MKSLSTFVGQALISRRDTHTYFDWVFEYTYVKEREKKYFVFAEDYQIENFCFEELVKRFLIMDVMKKNPDDDDFFIEDQFTEAVEFCDFVIDNSSDDEVKPRNDLFLQLNVKLFTPEFVLFDFVFFGYKYILRDIQMPMELYNEFTDRASPKIRFMKNFKVFIAHASEDKSTARQLAEDLTKQGYSAWFDEWEIKVGHSIVDKINHGIKEAAFMIVLFSPSSVDKPWVKREMNAGFMQELQRKKVYVLPALLEHCEIPPLFSDKRYADFTSTYKAGLDEIIKAL